MSLCVLTVGTWWLVSQGGLAHRCGSPRSPAGALEGCILGCCIGHAFLFLLFRVFGGAVSHITLAGCAEYCVSKQLQAPAAQLPLGHLSWPGKRGVARRAHFIGGVSVGLLVCVWCVWWPHGSFAGRVRRCFCACCQNCVCLLHGWYACSEGWEMHLDCLVPPGI